MVLALSVGGASHKALSGEPALVRMYYTTPYALFVVCLMNEAALGAAFLRAPQHVAQVEAATCVCRGGALFSYTPTLT